MEKKSRQKRIIGVHEPSEQTADRVLHQNNFTSIKTSQHFWPILIIVVISIAVYANTLKNEFVYDDEITIVNNSMIRSFSNLPKLFTSEYFASSGEMSYRPVVTLTYFVDHALYGMKPWGYHLTNLLLHAVNGIVLYFFIGLLTSSRNPAAALLFVVHPALTEAVNAISFREDLLAFTFYMSAFSIYVYLRQEARHSAPLYGLSCLLFFLALLSKEMAITLPLVIMTYERIYSDNKEGRFRAILQDRRILGYLAVALLYLVIRFYFFHNPAGENAAAWTPTERLLTIPSLITQYLMLALAPVSLSANHNVDAVSQMFSVWFILPGSVNCFV